MGSNRWRENILLAHQYVLLLLHVHCTLLVSPIAATPGSSESAVMTGIDDTQTRSFMMQTKKTIDGHVFLVPIG